MPLRRRIAGFGALLVKAACTCRLGESGSILFAGGPPMPGADARHGAAMILSVDKSAQPKLFRSILVWSRNIMFVVSNLESAFPCSLLQVHASGAYDS